MFYIFYAFVRLITLLPLRVLYIISDILYFLIYYIVGYRKKTVRKNLTESFPHKKKEDIIAIEKKFYRYFTDLIVETLKQLNISNSEIQQLLRFENKQLLLDEYSAGRSFFIITSHYCNWELCASGNLYLPTDKPLHSVYKKLKNQKFDDFMLKLRARYGGINVDKNFLVRKMIEMKKAGKLFSVAMIADQSPRNDSNKVLLQFLGRDTWFFSGTEMLARKFDMPVYYTRLKRIKRGSYVCEILPVCTEPASAKEGEITRKFAEILEQQILENPEFWLWTHNRWKV